MSTKHWTIEAIENEREYPKSLDLNIYNKEHIGVIVQVLIDNNYSVKIS